MTETDLTKKFRNQMKDMGRGTFIKITPGMYGNTGEPDLIGELDDKPVVLEAKKGHLKKVKDFYGLEVVLDRALTDLQVSTLHKWERTRCFQARVLIIVEGLTKGSWFYILADVDKVLAKDVSVNTRLLQDKQAAGDPVIWTLHVEPNQI